MENIIGFLQMIQNNGNFKCKKVGSKSIITKIDSPISYFPSSFGIKGLSGTGKGIKVCFIDSGFPNHNDVIVDKDKTIDFTNSSNKTKDVFGHGTAVSGILCSNSKNNITGIATEIVPYYAKALNDEGIGDFGSVIGSILWSVVQRVDLIVMSFGSDIVHPTFHDAIKKAYNSGIAMIASAGNFSVHTHDASFPARFPEVFAVGYSQEKTDMKFEKMKDSMGLIFSNKSITTTWAGNKFINFNGSSTGSAIIGGIGAIILEKMSSNQMRDRTPLSFYQNIMNLFED